MDKWEYERFIPVKGSILERLNQVGKEGWECVSVVYSSGLMGGWSIYCKRKIEPKVEA
jgi:hypothetical protein